MTVGELCRVLRTVDQGRMVYVPDTDGRAELVAAAVTLRHIDVPKNLGIRITDDIILLPLSMLDEEEPSE